MASYLTYRERLALTPAQAEILARIDAKQVVIDYLREERQALMRQLPVFSQFPNLEAILEIRYPEPTRLQKAISIIKSFF